MSELSPLEFRDTQLRPRLLHAADAYLDRLEALIDGYGGESQAAITAPAFLVERSVVVQLLAQHGHAKPLSLPTRAGPYEPLLDSFARSIRDKERSLLVWQLRDYLRWVNSALNGTSVYGLLAAPVAEELDAERLFASQALSFFTTEPSVAAFHKPDLAPTL